MFYKRKRETQDWEERTNRPSRNSVRPMRWVYEFPS